MCSVTCNATDVNKCRRILFANGASVESIPTASSALRQHIVRAVYKQPNGIGILRNKESN